MNLIEQIFGVSPDGGNGSTELMYLVVLGLIVLSYTERRTIRNFVGEALSR